MNEVFNIDMNIKSSSPRPLGSFAHLQFVIFLKVR